MSYQNFQQRLPPVIAINVYIVLAALSTTGRTEKRHVVGKELLDKITRIWKDGLLRCKVREKHLENYRLGFFLLFMGNS